MDLILCFILFLEEMPKLRTRINRAFTSFRTLLVLFGMTFWSNPAKLSSFINAVGVATPTYFPNGTIDIETDSESSSEWLFGVPSKDFVILKWLKIKQFLIA